MIWPQLWPQLCMCCTGISKLNWKVIMSKTKIKCTANLLFLKYQCFYFFSSMHWWPGISKNDLTAIPFTLSFHIWRVKKAALWVVVITHFHNSAGHGSVVIAHYLLLLRPYYYYGRSPPGLAYTTHKKYQEKAHKGQPTSRHLGTNKAGKKGAPPTGHNILRNMLKIWWNYHTARKYHKKS